MSVWLMNCSNWSGPWKIGISSPSRGERTQAETGNPSDFSTSAGAFAISPSPRNPMRRCSGRTIGRRSHSRLACASWYSGISRCNRSTCMTVYSVIIGSPPSGSILPSGTCGSFGWLMNASTPAERLNIAFKFGSAGIASKSGRMKARYSISAGFPTSGKMRSSRPGSSSATVSRQSLRVADLPVEPVDQQCHFGFSFSRQ